MTVYPPQPTLPAEGSFTDPELNFIDESPRGFFPDNQDSNWGYRRKVFSDQIESLFDQLAFIYSEAFPSTSQELLDEWEKLVGLPQNPANKSLAERRVKVLNRLRGGPFTRKQRREIVESYITATFGDPLLLLPPGVPMIVAGQPLYNEAGDLSQLYQIIEDVITFMYTVRIQSGLAIDQAGLERDLHHFTPAGINVVFDYAWTYKLGTDSGSSDDTVSSISGSAFLMIVTDLGVGREAIGKSDTQTGTGVDLASTGHTGTDSGTDSESAAFTVAFYDQDGGFGTETVDRKVVLSESGSGADITNSVGGPYITSFTPMSGPLYTEVSILGHGFTGATAVSFGGVSIYPFTVHSDTLITAPASGTGVVRVQTPSGEFATSDVFTVTP